jgi:hypothetical protein
LEKTKSGGLLTIITIGLLSTLMLAELFDQLTPPLVQNYIVDPNIGRQTDMIVDISVASGCEKLFVLQSDINGTMQFINDKLSMTDENFDELQYKSSDNIDSFRNEWSEKYKTTKCGNDSDSSGFLGCRIKGSLPVGNAGGGLMIIPMMSALGELGEILGRLDESINFSHFIHHLSFGRDQPDLAYNPLNGANQLALQPHEHFTYFLSVIHSTYRDTLYSGPITETNQYSLNGFKGRRGYQDTDNPGLFFRFQHEPLALITTRDRTPWPIFLIHLVGIVGGVYNCSGVIHRIVLAIWNLMTKALGFGKSHQRSKRFDAGWSPVMGEERSMIAKTVAIADDMDDEAAGLKSIV